MFWRLKRSQFGELGTEGRKAALRDLTHSALPPGLLAYADGQPVGWCCVGPREDFAALERSRILKRVDAAPVWSITCFFVAREARRKGVLRALLLGALRWAEEQGARMVEGYPLDMQSEKLRGKNLTGYSGFMGIASTYRDVGFYEVGRASEVQLLMRIPL
jgi:GNAT superfamily N-acetyltransferase